MACTVEMYSDIRPDLVTMDIRCEDGRHRSDKRIMAIIPVRDHRGKRNGAKAWLLSTNSGAKDFIVKPFQPDRIVEALQKLAVRLSCLR